MVECSILRSSVKLDLKMFQCDVWHCDFCRVVNDYLRPLWVVLSMFYCHAQKARVGKELGLLVDLFIAWTRPKI